MGDDGRYLGRFTNRFDSESVLNEFGQYGSRFAANSTNNEFGTYGSHSAGTRLCTRIGRLIDSSVKKWLADRVVKV